MYKVLVFPSCNEPGLEICHALLKSNKIDLYAGSSTEMRFDPSRMLCRNYVPCPSLYDQGFAGEFRDILKSLRIDLVFPTVDSLVAEFSRWQLEGTKFIVPGPQEAELLLSKSRTYAQLSGVVPLPLVFGPGHTEFPAFAKPDISSGSRGGSIVTDAKELDLAVSRKLLITEFLPGPEYTVDCVNNLQGELLHCSVRLRGVINRGISLGTESVDYPEIEGYIRAICSRITIRGPWFAQFKISREGLPKLMEVNARVGGSMTLTRLSGINIPLISVFLFMGHQVKVPKPLTNVLINRFLNAMGDLDDFTWVVWDFDDTIIRKDGKPDPEILACVYDFENRGLKQLLLTKNPDAVKIMQNRHLPDLFLEVCCTGDKIQELGNLLGRHGAAPKECIVINDSISETLLLQEQYPDIRFIRPDAVHMLGKERLY